MTSSGMTDQDFVRKAQSMYHCDGEIEIDTGAVVSRNDTPGESNGAYVQAWVWVDNDEQ